MKPTVFCLSVSAVKQKTHHTNAQKSACEYAYNYSEHHKFLPPSFFDNYY